MVEARFVCRHKSDLVKGLEGNLDGRQICLDAAQDEPSFQVATPAGYINMVITNQAADQFEPGNTYKVTFEKVQE